MPAMTTIEKLLVACSLPLRTPNRTKLIQFLPTGPCYSGAVEVNASLLVVRRKLTLKVVHHDNTVDITE